MATKADYALIHTEYVSGQLSWRELAAKHQVHWSTLYSYGRRLGWPKERALYRESLAKQATIGVAESFADEQLATHKESVIVARATLRAYAKQLSEGQIRVTPKDAMGAVSTLLLLMGEPTQRSEVKSIEFSTGGLDPDVLRRLVELARTRVVEGTVENTPRLGPGEPLED